ncbi:hypothetical protein AN958_12816 [Leucoagaricus sp. SymC.cos]|nr:hypothetical protein AN958_12816 [Leucoagaricus sp. SymC.cos]
MIQSLSIDKAAFHQLGTDFLPLCENLLSFTGSWPMWGSDPTWDDVLRAVLTGSMFPQLQRLCLKDVRLPNVFTYSLCQSLTHLDITLDRGMSWKGLEVLYNLNHIRVDALEQLPTHDHPVETSRGVREFIYTAVQHFPPMLRSFVLCVDPSFVLAAAILECETKFLRGGPPLFTDIVRGGIDPRVVLSCKTSPLVGWSDRRMSQRQIDETYDFVNEVVPYSFSFLPWDPILTRQKELYWLDLVQGIIHRRHGASRRIHAGAPEENRKYQQVGSFQ